MILELDDNRQIKLPDDMDEEVARQIGRLILETERRAVRAEKRADAFEAELATLRQRVDTLSAPAPADDGLREAVASLQSRLSSLLERVVSAVEADRVLARDEFGETTRSKIVRNN